jgi:hypothetical protein
MKSWSFWKFCNVSSFEVSLFRETWEQQPVFSKKYLIIRSDTNYTILYTVIIQLVAFRQVPTVTMSLSKRLIMSKDYLTSDWSLSSESWGVGFWVKQVGKRSNRNSWRSIGIVESASMNLGKSTTRSESIILLVGEISFELSTARLQRRVTGNGFPIPAAVTQLREGLACCAAVRCLCRLSVWYSFDLQPGQQSCGRLLEVKPRRR